MASKPRKRYNPHKQAQRAATHDVTATDVITLKIAGLDAATVQRHQTTMLSALDTLRHQWDVNAFRALTHYYRVGKHIAQTARLPYLRQQANNACQVLTALYDTDNEAPTLDATQYQVLRAYIVLLATTILPTSLRRDWDAANAAAVQDFDLSVGEEYTEIADIWRQAALRVLQGGKVREVATAIGKPEKELASMAVTVGTIGHGLAHDSLLPFPSNVTALRKIAPRVLPIITALEQSRTQAVAERRAA